MRITNKIIAANLNRGIQNNLSKVANTQEQLSTSKSMLRPSDKSGNMGPLLGVKATLSYFEQYERNLDDGLSYLNVTDGTMQTMGDMLHKASEMAVQGANGTYAAFDLATLGEQIDKIIDEMVDLSNTSVGRNYVFAGTKNASAPFKRVNDTILYSGNLGGIYREVMSGDNYRIDAPGITIGSVIEPISVTSTVIPKILSRPTDIAKVGRFDFTLPDLFSNQTQLDGVTPSNLIGGSPPVLGVDYDNPAPDRIRILTGDLAGLEMDFTGCAPGDQYQVVIDNKLGVFGHGTETAPGSGVYEVYNPISPKASPLDEGIFDALFRLRDNLNAGDHAAVGNSIEDINGKMDQLLQRRVGIGSRTIHFEALQAQRIDLEVKLKDVEQQLEGADMYKLSIQLAEQQVAYQASLSSGANMLQMTLLDFLK